MIRESLKNLREMFYELIGVRCSRLSAKDSEQILKQNAKLLDMLEYRKACDMIHYGKFRPKSYDEINQENTVLRLENERLKSRLSVEEGRNSNVSGR